MTEAVPRERFLACAGLTMIVLLAALLRLGELGDASLWLDEVIAIERALTPLSHLAESLHEQDTHPPLLHILLRSALYVGDNEWIVRFPSALIGTLTIPLLYALGKQILGQAAGLAAALLLAVSPFHVYLSREARPYPLLAALCLLALYALWQMLTKNEARWLVVFAVATALSLYTHYFAFAATAGNLLFAASVLAHDWLQNRKKESLHLALWLLFFCFIILLAYLPWVPMVQWSALPAGLGQTGPSGAAASRVGLAISLSELLLQEFGGGTNILANPTAWAFILGLAVAVWRSDRKTLILAVCWFLSAWVVIVILGPPGLLERYPRFVSYLQPLYVLIAAAGIEGLAAIVARRVGPRRIGRTPYVTLAIFSVLTLSVVSASAAGLYERWDKPDWKSAVAYLTSIAGEGDVVIVDGSYHYMSGGDSDRVQRVLSWYLPRTRKSISVWREIDVVFEVQAVAHEAHQVHAILYGDGGSVEDPEEQLSIAHFKRVLVLSLREPKPSTLDNAIAMLEAMPRFLKREEARFDVYLALAELYKLNGDAQQAEAYVAAALQNQPAGFDPGGWRAGAYRRLGLDHK